MAKFNRPKSVPKGMQATYDAIVRLTDEVCDRHLNAEYRELARDMAAALCRKRPSPLASGQPRTWACAILYELGRVNFLSDRSTQPSHDPGRALRRVRRQPEHRQRQGARHRERARRRAGSTRAGRCRA